LHPMMNPSSCCAAPDSTIGTSRRRVNGANPARSSSAPPASSDAIDPPLVPNAPTARLKSATITNLDRLNSRLIDVYVLA
jgi:hypothetical protein